MSTDQSATDPFEHDDAAYAMGALDAADTAAFEAHLLSCPACRARVRDAQATLALLGPSTAAGAPGAGVPDRAQPRGEQTAPPDTLLPSLVRAVRHEQRRRRAVVGSLAGVAAACILALVFAVWPTSGPTGTSPTAARAMTAVAHDTPIRASVELTGHRWGTAIDVRCRYADGYDADVAYDLRVLDSAGVDHAAGSWQLGSGGSIDFVSGVQVPRARIREVQVTLPDGRPVLRLAVR